jgi:hypothetical protein
MTHKVLIAGVGMTPFTALGCGHASELTKSAVSLALADTDLDLNLIDQTFFAWAWSPIRFQADMGILLTFMFLWNMLGALILIPALPHFLLRLRRR